MNKNIPIVIIFAVLIFLLCVSIILGLRDSSAIKADKEGKSIWECSVQIDEELFGTNVHITDLECYNTGSSCIFPFNLFTTEGTIELHDSTGLLASKDYKTGLFDGRSLVTLRACTKVPTYMRLYDDSHNLIDSKRVAQ